MKLAIALSLSSAAASADPIRLRADALATTDAPAGLVTVEADARQGSDLSAEAVVWIGGGTIGDTGHADVLVMALRARTLDGRLAGRFGRFVESLGALRPVQVDGAAARVRLPYQLDVEIYGGVPVVAVTATTAGPDVEPFASVTQTRAWDWVVGGRVARRLGDSGSVGIAYAEQRDDGQLESEEIGIDAGTSINKRDDVAAKLAYDLANPGLAQVSIVASRRYRKLRVDVYSSYLAASHLLPATSLFSVLGDVPAERAGTTLTWKIAPRLDVGGDVGVRHGDDDTAPEIALRARLRLDERGTSALGCELRRDGVGDDKWTGARGVARIALPYALTASTEIELAIPDHARGLGAVWPWALVALAWDNATWHAAIAGEASASPQDRRRVDVLAQLGWHWGKL